MKTARTTSTTQSAITKKRTSALHSVRRIITLPRLAVVFVLLCLLFQLQRGKSHEVPKYTAPAFMERSLLERINEHRASIKAKPLVVNHDLHNEAQRYCEMIAKGNLQASLNYSGSEGLSEVAHWDAANGVQRNVAVLQCESTSPALDVLRSWINNPRDVSNIENEHFTTTGIGIARQGNTYVVCQIFAR